MNYNYYRVTFCDIDRTETIGVRAYNMYSAMQTVVDKYEGDYSISFLKIERDMNVVETLESDYYKEIRPVEKPDNINKS